MAFELWRTVKKLNGGFQDSKILKYIMRVSKQKLITTRGVGFWTKYK